MTAGTDPEKWKERWLKWAHQSRVAKFLVNQLFIRVCYLLCVNPCAPAAVSVLRPSWREWSKLRCLAFCSKYVDYSLFTLSEWLMCISPYTSFTRMVCSSKSECSNKEYYGHWTSKGGGSPPNPPPCISPWTGEDSAWVRVHSARSKNFVGGQLENARL